MTGPTLRLGSTGEDVRRLQELLRSRGHRVRVDGYFGGSTYGALLSLQQREGVRADGVAGPETWRALGEPRQERQERHERPQQEWPRQEWQQQEWQQQGRGERARWTLMVCFAGENDLSDAAGRDLEELRSAPAQDGVRVTAFVRESGGRARHLVLGAGGERDHTEEAPGSGEPGDTRAMREFVRWAARRAPAERYALVLWNHGRGRRADDLDRLYAEARGRRVRRDVESGYVRRAPRTAMSGEEPSFSELVELAEHPAVARAVFTEPVKRLLTLPAEHERAAAARDGTLRALDAIELRELLAGVQQDLGRPLDVLGLDACPMSDLEVCYEVREHVGVVVGAEEPEPAGCWPYGEIVAALAADPRADARSLGRIVVERYADRYRGTRHTVTQCAMDATRVEEFLREFHTLAGALRGQVRMNRSVVDSVQSVATRFAWDRSLVDLRTMCLGLVADSRTDPTLASVADKLLAMHQPGGFIVQEAHQGEKVEDCGGLSVYFPMDRTISRYYADLGFARDTEWGEFLREYANARTIKR
ncbi:clostripain-related cysteine peptidase [Actinomadura sp. ATCC 31491]|uniref:Clostripain-related cysteine peptidase n=1 Tax=Actinomadura luzonensis TaxID=2805427 RepID=A0ABT0FKP1_9ACTN|nr:clostripain-related cysteine peptidase [Actinomadura luzonensis]MCK2212625.1 clostripain-related cysteine peptidase [Actinomadura luzonensis]